MGGDGAVATTSAVVVTNLDGITVSQKRSNNEKSIKAHLQVTSNNNQLTKNSLNAHGVAEGVLEEVVEVLVEGETYR